MRCGRHPACESWIRVQSGTDLASRRTRAARRSSPRAVSAARFGIDDHEPDLGLARPGRRRPWPCPWTRPRLDLIRRPATSSRSWSPGTTGLRSLDVVDRDDQGELGRRVDDVAAIMIPAACARASTIRTPGMIGRSGQWPWKNGSLMLTFLIADHASARARARARGRPAGTGSDGAGSS